MIRHATLKGSETADYDVSREKVLGKIVLGKRVRFKSTTDAFSELVFNDLGTITAVFESTECVGRQNKKLWIRWDSGCLHPLIDGVDSFDIFEEDGI
jgi:hypothetical protein